MMLYQIMLYGILYYIILYNVIWDYLNYIIIYILYEIYGSTKMTHHQHEAPRPFEMGKHEVEWRYFKGSITWKHRDTASQLNIGCSNRHHVFFAIPHVLSNCSAWLPIQCVHGDLEEIGIHQLNQQVRPRYQQKKHLPDYNQTISNTKMLLLLSAVHCGICGHVATYLAFFSFHESGPTPSHPQTELWDNDWTPLNRSKINRNLVWNCKSLILGIGH